MEIDFYKFCKDCKGTMCCTKPFFAFSTDSERNKILEYLQTQNLTINDAEIFVKRQSSKFVTGIPYYLINKKENGECIFLKEDKSCLIQPVKPLDCLFWPLTFEFNPNTDELDILLGDCFFTKQIKKARILKEWVAKEQENLIKQIPNFSRDDLIAYNSLPNIAKFHLIFTITIPKV
jgi:Fe-S-cluster containining protein